MPARDSDKKAPIHSEQTFHLSLTEICCSFGVEKEWVEAIVEEGIIQPVSETSDPHFDTYAIRRLRISIRLQQDLEVNLAGIALALDLLEEIEQLQQKLPQET